MELKCLREENAVHKGYQKNMTEDNACQLIYSCDVQFLQLDAGSIATSMCPCPCCAVLHILPLLHVQPP
jgi:hypothetical protein